MYQNLGQQTDRRIDRQTDRWNKNFYCGRRTIGVPGLGLEFVMNDFYCGRMTIGVPGLVTDGQTDRRTDGQTDRRTENFYCGRRTIGVPGVLHRFGGEVRL